MPRTYFEDLVEGEALACRPVLITREEILEFARRFDPLPFHVDAEAARASLFGDIIASSLHTLSACTRVVVEAQGDLAVLSGLGIDEVRLLSPVRPGDVLSVEARWNGLRRSRSKPGRAFAGIRCSVTNQRGEGVAEYGYRYLVACRDAAGAPAGK